MAVRSQSRPLRREVLSYGSGKAVVGLVGAAIIPILVRTMGTERYGIYGLALSLSLLSSRMAAGWLQQVFLRYTSRYRTDRERHQFIRRMRGPAAASVSAAVMFTLVLIRLDQVSSWNIAMASALFSASMVIFTLAFAYSQSRLHAQLAAGADSTRVLIPAALLLFLWLVGFHTPLTLGVHTVFLIFSVGALAASLLVWRRETRVKPVKQHRLPKESIRPYFRYGWPYTVWFAAAAAFPVVARSALRLQDPDLLGAFVAYQEISIKLATLGLIPVTLAAHARLMDNANRSRPTIDFVKLALTVEFAVGLLLVSLGGLFGKWLPGLLGLEGGLAVRYLVGILSAEVIGQLGLLVHKGLEVGEKTGLMAMFMVLALASFAVIVVLLTPLTGAVEAVITGLIVSRIFYAAVTFAAGRRYLRQTSTHD